MNKLNKEIQASDLDRIIIRYPKLAKPLKKSFDEFHKGDYVKTLNHLTKVWEKVPDSEDILIVMAFCLLRTGARQQVILALKIYLEHHEPSAEICSIFLELATKMEIFSVAEKVAHILIGMNPGNPEFHADYISVLNSQERYDEVVDYCQKILPMFPQSVNIWNALAVAVQYRDNIDQALVFYKEVFRLDPNNFIALNNITTAMPDFNKQKEYLDRSWNANKEHPEANMGLALYKFWNGELKDAWPHYKYRMHRERSSTQHINYTHGIPEWKGQNLKGKTFFATCEQGIGDEVMFATILPKLYEEAEQLIIGVDPRLVSIFERSFPKAIVCGYTDKLMHGYRYRVFPSVQRRLESGELKADYACPFGTIPSFYWSKTEDVQANLKPLWIPDPSRVNDYRKRFQELTSKPLVGLAWTTGNKSKTRSHFYPAIEDMGTIMALKDHVTFVNLQYGDVTEDIAEFKKHYDVDIIQFEDIDLRADIEANAALMKCCDLIISVTSAPAQFAMAVGTPIIILSFVSSIWWAFGKKNTIPYVEEGKSWVVHGENDERWETIIPKASIKAKEFFGLQ